MAVATSDRIAEISQDLVNVVTQLCLVSPRGRRRAGDLKEIEFLTLAILQDHGTMIVGDIQRLLHVLPAQMSRIIRSLESRPEPFIACRINPQDKRKIDVVLTDAGDQALHGYQSARVRRVTELLRDLSEEDQESLVRLLERVRCLLDSRPIRS